MTVPDVDELLTVAEVAERLRLNPQTIRNWIDAGRLPHLRLGRRVRIYRRDLDALIARSETQPRPRPAPEPTIWDGVIPMPVVPPGR